MSDHPKASFDEAYAKLLSVITKDLAEQLVCRMAQMGAENYSVVVDGYEVSVRPHVQAANDAECA